MEDQHPIEGLMETAMDSIKDMVDVNTIIGEPIETSNNVIIIPISKVGFGFAAGGSEFRGETIGEYSKKEKTEEIQYKLPFGGGSGAGVSIMPIAFLVVQANNVKLLPVNHSSAIDKLLDYVPDLFEKVNNMLNKMMQNKSSNKNESQKKEQGNNSEQSKNEEDKQKENKENEQKIDSEKTSTKIRKTVDKIDNDKQMINKTEKNIVREKKVNNDKAQPKRGKNNLTTKYEYTYDELEDMDDEFDE